MTMFVFLGPSLPVDRAREILEAQYLPPVSMGDLYTLVRSRARAGDYIAIVDGFFEQVPAVWHKEILYALSCGINVFGASSMGALRAAETHSFGMVGIGRIFEAFRDGELTDDDEVAVAHADADADYRSLSVAMAALRFGLGDLARDGAIPEELARTLIDAAKALPYARRSWGETIGEARRIGADENAIEAIRALARQPDAKARDSISLLEHLAALDPTAQAPHIPDFTFQKTSFWTGLTAAMAVRVATADDDDSGTTSAAAGRDAADEELAVAAFARAGAPSRESLMDGALLDRLAVDWTAGYEPDRRDRAIAVARIARRNGLSGAQALADWRALQGMNDDRTWQRVIDRECRRHWLRSKLVVEMEPFLVSRMRVEGAFADLRCARRRARDRITETAVAKPSLADFGLAPADLQEWYQERFGPMLPDPATHAETLGFATLGEFIASLLECYLAAEHFDTACNPTGSLESGSHSSGAGASGFGRQAEADQRDQSSSASAPAKTRKDKS